MTRLAVVGGGRMGEALVSGLLSVSIRVMSGRCKRSANSITRRAFRFSGRGTGTVVTAFAIFQMTSFQRNDGDGFAAEGANAGDDRRIVAWTSDRHGAR